MYRYEVEDEITRKYKERKKKVLNSNALSEFFSAIPSSIDSVGKIFLGIENASEVEEIYIKQGILLEILYEIDNKISDSIDGVIEKKDIRKIISSEIEASGYDIDEVIGVIGLHVGDELEHNVG